MPDDWIMPSGLWRGNMNITLTVVVSAIVILITALVVITIFGSGITQVTSITQAKAICATQMQSTCSWAHANPATWTSQNLRIGDTPTSCSAVLSGCNCEEKDGIWKPTGTCA